MIYFTADTHFNHKNIIKYCNRPFETLEEMNNKIIDNWNILIQPRDTVYHLGDFGFGNLENILNRLQGQKILITGSHDTKIHQYKKYFSNQTPLLEIKANGQTITLCHYAMRVWPKSHYNSWHLFGHSHSELEPQGKSYDVGVDNNDFKPISLEQITKIMNNRPDNFNLVGTL